MGEPFWCALCSVRRCIFRGRIWRDRKQRTFYGFSARALWETPTPSAGRAWGGVRESAEGREKLTLSSISCHFLKEIACFHPARQRQNAGF